MAEEGFLPTVSALCYMMEMSGRDHPSESCRFCLPTTGSRMSSVYCPRNPLGADARTLYRKLMSRGVVCAQRGGGIRFSPHFYTPEAVLERAIDITAEIAKRLNLSVNRSH
jgi:hypothetical protein